MICMHDNEEFSITKRAYDGVSRALSIICKANRSNHSINIECTYNLALRCLRVSDSYSSPPP